MSVKIANYFPRNNKKSSLYSPPPAPTPHPSFSLPRAQDNWCKPPQQLVNRCLHALQRNNNFDIMLFGTFFYKNINIEGESIFFHSVKRRLLLRDLSSKFHNSFTTLVPGSFLIKFQIHHLQCAQLCTILHKVIDIYPVKLYTQVT